MTPEQFLENLLRDQTLSEEENRELIADKTEVETLIREEFGAVPDILYGGSYAKWTMVKESYDLDVVCYFPRENEDNPETLEDIYDSVKDTLAENYELKEKTSAIHIKRKITNTKGYHIDVVPGRYIEGQSGDVFLHKNKDGSRIQTNIRTHIDNVRKSERADLIRLFKIWNLRNSLRIKTFVLELFAIKILEWVWWNKTELFARILRGLVEEIENIRLVDPANEANVISELISSERKKRMKELAFEHLALLQKADEKDTQAKLEAWEKVFKDNRDEKAVFYSTPKGIHVSNTVPANAPTIIPNRPWRVS